MKTFTFFNKVWMVITIGVICFLGFNPPDVWAKGKILFVSSRTGNNDIWIMDIDGTTQTPIYTSTAYQIAYTAWSPGGSKITLRQGTYNYGNFAVIQENRRKKW